MGENKTQPSTARVDDFIDGVEHDQRRRDSRTVLAMMREITGEEPVLWGPSIVGFGSYHYRYDSGREGDFFRTGFSPRKQALTLYIMGGFERHDELLAKLGKYRTGKSCLYVNRLTDVDEDVLRELIRASWEHMRATYGEPGADSGET